MDIPFFLGKKTLIFHLCLIFSLFCFLVFYPLFLRQLSLKVLSPEEVSLVQQLPLSALFFSTLFEGARAYFSLALIASVAFGIFSLKHKRYAPLYLAGALFCFFLSQGGTLKETENEFILLLTPRISKDFILFLMGWHWLLGILGYFWGRSLLKKQKDNHFLET